MSGESLFERWGFTHDETWALAEFVKRVGWNEIRINASSEEEAYLIRYSLEKLRNMLSEAGYSPR
jgi:hypothetical protein